MLPKGRFFYCAATICKANQCTQRIALQVTAKAIHERQRLSMHIIDNRPEIFRGGYLYDKGENDERFSKSLYPQPIYKHIVPLSRKKVKEII
jgi:hypothetical protein